jgi:hypothetical protein
MARIGNRVDPYDYACDAWLMDNEGGLEGWHALPRSVQAQLEIEITLSNIMEGYWFRWRDGSVRDWPED